LCNRTFLSLWSHAGIYRDQGPVNKEVCDLLVVFEKHVLIFSDKYCEVPRTGKLALDWARWFRRAVEDSARQTWAAERWIRSFPDRLYLDRQCKQRFPFEIPHGEAARFHLIVVAHGIAARCREEHDGSGSLMLRSDLIGPKAHTIPFAIGDLDAQRSFVHVLDDVTLEVLLRTLDTVSDFVAYLDKKERLFRSGRPVLAAGEEELLALYLKRMNALREHDFDFPNDADGVAVSEGHWDAFQRNPQRLAQIEANRISYMWDALIEQFSRHAIAGTQLHVSPPDITSSERVVRFLAREPRLRRRMLARGLWQALKATPSEKNWMRCLAPSREGDPYYVFLLFRREPEIAYEEYRNRRRMLLEAYCRVAKFQFKEAMDIVGIATEPGLTENERSEDALYLNCREWDEEAERMAEEFHRELGLFRNTTRTEGTEKEYPEIKRLGRNERCWCGSGTKYKKCHGR
jgi:hypothetical protein